MPAKIATGGGGGLINIDNPHPRPLPEGRGGNPPSADENKQGTKERTVLCVFPGDETARARRQIRVSPIDYITSLFRGPGELSPFF